MRDREMADMICGMRDVAFDKSILTSEKEDYTYKTK